VLLSNEEGIRPAPKREGARKGGKIRIKNNTEPSARGCQLEGQGGKSANPRKKARDRISSTSRLNEPARAGSPQPRNSQGEASIRWEELQSLRE